MDDLGIDGDALAKPVVVLPQGLGGGFGIYCVGVQMLERGWDAVRFGLSADEFFFQVNVLVRRCWRASTLLDHDELPTLVALLRGRRPGA